MFGPLQGLGGFWIFSGRGYCSLPYATLRRVSTESNPLVDPRPRAEIVPPTPCPDLAYNATRAATSGQLIDICRNRNTMALPCERFIRFSTYLLGVSNVCTGSQPIGLATDRGWPRHAKPGCTGRTVRNPGTVRRRCRHRMRKGAFVGRQSARK